MKRSSAFNRAYQELLLHQKVLDDPVELNKLLALRIKKREAAIRRMSLPAADNKKTKKSPKNPTPTAATTNKRLNKTFGGNVKGDADIFDFNDSVADFESFHLQKSYTPKRRIRRTQSCKKCFLFYGKSVEVK